MMFLILKDGAGGVCVTAHEELMTRNLYFDDHYNTQALIDHTVALIINTGM
jgi:hypothetical protein